MRRLQVADRASRAGVVGHHGLTVAGSLGHPDVARDDRPEHLVRKVGPHLRGDLVGQSGAAVVHRQEHGGHVDAGVQVCPYQLDGVEQLCQPLQGVVLTLDRNEYLASRDQRVQREQAERRRAVDEHVVRWPGISGRAPVDRGRGQEAVDGPAQPVLACHLRGQLDVGAGEVERGRDAGQGGSELGRPCHVGDGHAAEQDLVGGRRTDGMRDAECCTGVSLRVAVDDTHAKPVHRQRCGQIDRAGGLADSTFLVGHREHPGRSRRGPALLTNVLDVDRPGGLASNGRVEAIRFT